MPRRTPPDIPILSTLLGARRLEKEAPQDSSDEEETLEVTQDMMGDTLPDIPETYTPSADTMVRGTEFSETEWLEAMARLEEYVEDIAGMVDDMESEDGRIFDKTLGESGPGRMKNKLAMEIHEIYADQGKVTLRELASTLIGLTEMWVFHLNQEIYEEAMGPIDIVEMDIDQWEQEADDLEDRREESAQRLERVSDRMTTGDDGSFLPRQEERLRQTEKADRAAESGVSPQAGSSEDQSENDGDSLRPSAMRDGDDDGDDEGSAPAPTTGGPGGDPPGDAGSSMEDVRSPRDILNRLQDRGDAD